MEFLEVVKLLLLKSNPFLAQDSRVLPRNLILRESDSKTVTRLQPETRNRSGEFEFVEFVEVVKLLLLRMREATQAEGTFEEMQVPLLNHARQPSLFEAFSLFQQSQGAGT